MTDAREPAPADDADPDEPAAEPTAADTDGTFPSPSVKLTKAERLEAKAARLREAEERRAVAAAERAASGQAVPGRSLTIPLVIVSAAAVALIATLAVFLVAWDHQRASAQHLRDVSAARASAVKAATAFAVDFGSYDYQHLDTEFAEVAARMTPDFAKSYTSTSTKLKPTLVQYKTKVTATVQGYGITSGGTAKATVVVFLDQTVMTSQSSVPRLDRNRLQIQLQHTKGKWLVAKLLAK